MLALTLLSYRTYKKPITKTELELAEVNPGNLERDYTTSNLESIVDQVVNDFNLERDKVSNYFRCSKYASLAKQLFNRIDFDLQSNGNKLVSLSGTVMKIIKNGNEYRVVCRKAGISAQVERIAYKLSPKTQQWERYDVLPFFKYIHFMIKSWEPLTGDQITSIYNQLNSMIAGTLNAYKAI